MQRADRRRFHYIYKITRILDKKFYIGMHSTDNLDDGYFGSGNLITRSIKKYGKEAHVREILEFLPDRTSLKAREKEIVNEDCLQNKSCMNLQLGGGGGFIDEEHQFKCASAGGLANGSKVAWERHRTKMSKAASDELKRRHQLGLVSYTGMLGKSHSEKAKQKMSESHLGEKNSQFGTCWVTNGVKPVKIKKEKLDEYLLNGYSRGKKIKQDL